MAADMTGGTLRLADDLQLTRMGFGAMRLAGPGVWGPPPNRDEAIAVLRAVVRFGLNHIGTSDYYGPYTVNNLIREALHARGQTRPCGFRPLLGRSPTMLLIPGTSSLAHLRDNVAAAQLLLPDEARGRLNSIGSIPT